ncbi:MAG: AAA family ATPase [Candidatus Aminicenantes bacterium]|nr:AAA family ATPase [Candidatus Aminicenantes bacterium]
MVTKRFAKHEKQYLPLSKSTFSKLVEGNCIYVDKTRYIHPLVKAGGAYFLSRPRRFGKSLMVSILKEIYQGRRELFKDYWIYDRIAWEKYPVIHLDFLNIDFRTLGLEKAIDNELERISQDCDIQCSGDSISEKFASLIGKLAQDRRIAVLVDEYDKPVTEYIEDIDTAVKNRDILRNFYSVLKGKEEKIEFLFMTGISRFTRLSIFSDLNHLTDITFHKDYSNLLGYTGEELEKYFDAYIHEWLRLHKSGESTKTGLMEKLKDYYNGYSWNGKDFVYNPYSINNFFYNMEFKNYWFASGTTTSLVKLVKEKNIVVENWEYLEVQEQFFDKFDIADININLMLFQTGYLTVKKHLEDTYVLSYPNREVEHALLNNLMEVYSGHNQEDTEKLIKNIMESLKKKQMDSFIDQMKALFASIPYNLVEAGAERFYHLVFYLVLKLLIGKVYPEKYTNKGRIDAVVETDGFIYVIEFKIGSAAEALKQILEKKYYEQYLAHPKTIVLLGIGFSVKDRNISSFETIEGSGKDLPGYIKKIKAEETGKPGAGAVKPAGISPDEREKGGMVRRLWQRMRKR